MATFTGSKKRVLVFASGDAEGGGSGFQEMVEQSRTNPPILDAQISGVISNYPHGGVFQKARTLEIPFEYWTGPFTEEGYRIWMEKYRADYAMCSGWLKPVEGLDPARTINIHPGPLNYADPKLHFGGKGMWGHHVHEAVMDAYRKGKLAQSAVTMHFVTPYSTEGYDRGPVFFQMPVLIRSDDTPDTLAKRVNEKERAWQSKVLSMVVNGHIFLHDGKVGYTDHFCKKIFYGIF